MKKISNQIRMLSFILLFATPAMAEISVIVHPDNAITSISEKDLKKIFLGKSKKFPDGGKVRPVDQSGGTTKEAFHSTITKKKAAKLKAYWSRMVFTGKAQSPKEVADDAEMITKVISDPTAIGYVDSNTVNDAVKVIMKIP